MGSESRVGLVLSGGGARGAYEAGVLLGIAEATGATADGRSLFQVVAGTSVGAINGAWVVANADRGDHDASGLARMWKGLEISRHLRLDVLGGLGWANPLARLFRGKSAAADQYFGRSLLDPRGLEAVVERAIDWPRLHRNVSAGLIHAFAVAALHIGTGVTALFAELAPGANFKPVRHPRQVSRVGQIGFDHIMASAAIPALFPARRIGSSYFVDGGLRFNTPIAPAIRAGAQKLVVVTLRHDHAVAPDIDAKGASFDEYPSVIFLLGKIFNALLLDPVAHDLQVLERFNRLWQVLDTSLSADELARVDQLLEETRGMAYRNIPTLVFEPTQDIGVLAGEHLREHLGGWDLGRLSAWLLSKAANSETLWEADLASYLLFDGGWAAKLIELGRQDALAQRTQIRDFFG
jgi:NTE family protein